MNINVTSCFEHVWQNLFVFLVISYCEHWRVQYKLFVKSWLISSLFFISSFTSGWILFTFTFYIGSKHTHQARCSRFLGLSSSQEIFTFPIRSRSVKAGHLEERFLIKVTCYPCQYEFQSSEMQIHVPNKSEKITNRSQKIADKSQKMKINPKKYNKSQKVAKKKLNLLKNPKKMLIYPKKKC